jgi:hypothetical protein
MNKSILTCTSVVSTNESICCSGYFHRVTNALVPLPGIRAWLRRQRAYPSVKDHLWVIEHSEDIELLKKYLKPFGYTVTEITWYVAWNPVRIARQRFIYL